MAAGHLLFNGLSRGEVLDRVVERPEIPSIEFHLFDSEKPSQGVTIATDADQLAASSLELIELAGRQRAERQRQEPHDAVVAALGLFGAVGMNGSWNYAERFLEIVLT